MYRQCELRQPNATGDGVLRYVAWLPAEYRVGRVVRIDGQPGEWKIVSQGEARNRDLVEAYEANARRGLPSVSGREDA
jgi:hypothetical protein